jgi:hypothetical protein
MNDPQTTTTGSPVRVAANYSVSKHLGHWTTARSFEVRSHRGHAVLDLRSPRIPAGDITVDVDLDHGMLKLLVPDDATIDDWDLRRTGRGKVKDLTGATEGTEPGRRIVLTGEMRHAEIRVHRGGIAVLSAIFSREFLTEARQAHREGRQPSVADPAQSA